MRPAHDMTVGRVLPKFVTPADVRDLKNRIDPFVAALDHSVATCATVPAGVKTGWEAFSKAWRTYFDEEDSWWHTAAQMDQGEAYEQDVARWQDWIGHFKCEQEAPPITPSTTGDTGNVDRWPGTIRTVAIAGAVIAGVVALRTVLK
jgi:hypothetical protein